MGHNVSKEKRRLMLMRMPIGELAAWHLMVVCPRHRDQRFVPLQVLVDSYGAERRLMQIVPRMRCRFPTCREKPTSVRLRSRLESEPGPELIEVVLVGPGAY